MELKNPRDPSFPPFLDACKECNLTLVQSLVKDRDPSDGSLTFGLRFAFGADRIDIARCLLDHRAIIDVDTVERIKSLAGFQLLLEYSNPPLALAPTALQSVPTFQGVKIHAQIYLGLPFLWRTNLPFDFSFLGA